MVAVLVLGVVVLSAGFVNWSFLASFDLSAITAYYPALARGLGITLALTAAAMVLATIVGCVLAAASRSGRVSRVVITAYVEVFRSIPILIMLFWVHFVLPLTTGVRFDPWVSGLLAMVLQASAYMTDVIMAGVAAVPRGQWDASRALGLSRFNCWRLVVFPQAFRVMLPSVTNVFASMLKASTILSALSIAQLWQVAQQIGTYTFRPLEALTVAAVMYYIVGKSIAGAMRLLERRLKHP